MTRTYEYKLAYSLEGHDDDVKAVKFINSSTIISASRDASVRLWTLHSPSRQADCIIASQGKVYTNSLAYLPPNVEYPQGLIFSGGQDGIIDARAPGTALDESGLALLVGHASNVCALDISADGQYLVSGSWDWSARLWKVGKWESEMIFEHQANVWAVLMYDSKTIITACADKFIRIFETSGRLVREIGGSEDVIRALCKLPSNHPSGAHFASAGNDNLIRLWTLQGDQVAVLLGHGEFIYSLTSLPSGELVSSGEDRTTRIWKGTECVQTITHPAVSVWSVAACTENGDIVTGASDRIVRVFTRDESRQAKLSVQEEFVRNVQSFAIPKQQVGNINKDKLPGPDFIQQKLGTKDGQVQMIREGDGTITAYTWSSSTNQWVNIGTVVDSAGSTGRKTEQMGQDYDYVFDVDIEDGKPPLRLPYNLSQNPYVVAQKFIADNELPVGYLDQVTQFIINNTHGTSFDTTAESAPDQISAELGATATTTAPAQPKLGILPQKAYLSIKTANLKVIYRKVQEINSKLESEGSKDITLNPSEIEVLGGLVEELEKTGPLPESKGLDIALQLVARIAISWPAASRIPGLDLLRLLAVASPTTATTEYADGDLITTLLASGVLDHSSTDFKVNNAMLTIRTFANLFETDSGRKLVATHFNNLVSHINNLTVATLNNTSPRNLTIALATFYVNLAVYLTRTGEIATIDSIASAEQGLVLMEPLYTILTEEEDSEAIYRALVAVGTLLFVPSEELKSAAKNVVDVPAALDKILAANVGREPRIRRIVAELNGLLK
ncbi:hypothetical protein KEM54_002660 [Ascosphaera aggregata]|nr:hypothetical protein KEM54_002660 [Ascosphaera aggregata]